MAGRSVVNIKVSLKGHEEVSGMGASSSADF